MIRGTRELLSAVLRDIVYIRHEITANGRFDLNTSDGITNAVFHIVRNAGLMGPPASVNMVVCWGGHAISSRRIRLHEAGWLRNGAARPERVHRLWAWGYEGADERRNDWSCQAAYS